MQNSKAAVAWKLRTRTLDLTRPRIMGIVNVTPDSFSDGGEHATTEAAVAWGRKLAADGADIIDVGGESTRPGAADVSLEEELARVIPVVKTLAREGLIVSVDTSKPEVMREAAAAGAEILNDIRGFREAGATFCSSRKRCCLPPAQTPRRSCLIRALVSGKTWSRTLSFLRQWRISWNSAGPF